MTSVATTAFCGHKLEGSDGRHLWIDGNGKITAGNGTLNEPSPNAFSLVQIADCPFATSICKSSCYVHGLEKHAPDTHDLYKHNSVTIREILVPPPAPLLPVDSPTQWARRMGTYIAKNCTGGFRWHVSGDVFSPRYAAWIVDVCEASPNVQHWIYTRSFGFAPILAEARNLTVNLSCDAENYRAAQACREYIQLGPLKRNTRLCYLSHDGVVPFDLPEDSVIFPDYELRGGTERGGNWWGGLLAHEKKMVCPVDYHGKSEKRRCGPCEKCIKEPK